jgi:hypothetical protein
VWWSALALVEGVRRAFRLTSLTTIDTHYHREYLIGKVLARREKSRLILRFARVITTLALISTRSVGGLAGDIPETTPALHH